MTPSADPHEISTRNFWIMHLANFCPNLLRFFRPHFFLCRQTVETFRDWSVLLGAHLTQKLPLLPPVSPCRKCDQGGQKNWSKFLLCPILSKGQLNLKYKVRFISWGKKVLKFQPIFCLPMIPCYPGFSYSAPHSVWRNSNIWWQIWHCVFKTVCYYWKHSM